MKQRTNVSREAILGGGVFGLIAIVVLCVTLDKFRSADRHAGSDDHRPIPTVTKEPSSAWAGFREFVPSVGTTTISAAWVEEGALARDKQTAEGLIQFIFTGKSDPVGNISPGDVASLLQHLGDTVPADAAARVADAKLGIPRGMYPDAITFRNALGDLFSALAARPATVAEAALPTAPFTPLVFTEQCDDDGKILGAANSIPAGVGRVYAVFENQGTLAGLDYVFAAWHSLDNATAVYSHCEPLRVATAYNFVYLDLEKGWPSGNYRLDLFDPRNRFQLLATQRFAVR